MSLEDFRMSYEWNPITLVGGIAQNMNGGSINIFYLLQPGVFPNGLLSGGSNVDPSQVFAHFEPVSGGKLINNEIAEYPLANQIVAANANIVQPLRISLAMTAPAQGDGGYVTKLSTMTSLQRTLAQHTLTGGTYNVATPAFIYTNCVLLDLVDISGGETKQVQTRWQWNFEQPLLTLAQAQQAQSSLTSRLTSQTQVMADSDGKIAWTSASNTPNQPQSLTAPFFAPSSAGPVSSGVSGLVAQT